MLSIINLCDNIWLILTCLPNGSTDVTASASRYITKPSGIPILSPVLFMHVGDPIFLLFKFKKIDLLVIVHVMILLLWCVNVRRGYNFAFFTTLLMEVIEQSFQMDLISNPIAIITLTVTKVICTSIKIIKNEVGCRDDTVPKTGDTRRHCEVELTVCNNLPQPPKNEM